MTLRQYLSAMAGNKGTQITLLTLNETELLTFNVEGYEAVESDILDRGVKKVDLIKTPTTVGLKITLFDLVVLPESPEGNVTND